MLSFPESNMIDYKVTLCDQRRYDTLLRTPIIQEAENLCECELSQSYEKSCIILLQYYILVIDVS